VLARHDLTWARDGYGNDWDYSIVLQYQGASTLSFLMLLDSEPAGDFVQVEADSGGASESRVDYVAAPMSGPSAYRQVLLSMSGLQNSAVGPLALPDFGVPATVHEVYIRFESDDSYSDEDGLYASAWNAGLVVDDIVVTGGLTYSEDFEGALDPRVKLANTAPSTPFGEWARLWPHATDNDVCTENSTCAWIFSDPTLPASTPQMAFGPGGAVVRNWLDDVLVSPWVELGGTAIPGAVLLSYRRFAGSDFASGRIVMSWSIRSRVRLDNTDTSAPGDSIDAVTPWRHTSNWSSLSSFTWLSSLADASTYVPAGAAAVQVRFRVSDWQYIAAAAPPVTLDPGPGPYLDRVRVGVRTFTRPSFTNVTGRWLAQDTFASVQEFYQCAWESRYTYHSTTDRFGTGDFSRGGNILWGDVDEDCIARCDSIQFSVRDQRGVGMANVWLFGAIVSGPHAGKAPPPWTVEPSGFFRVPAFRGMDCWGTSFADLYTVDLDDEYFRGGDVLLYFLVATDNAGGFASYPPGLASEPSSVTQAELATGGLLEVSFLPAIDWDPAYLARIAAHPSGKLDPTPGEIANSSQRSCMLYVNQLVDMPRSGLGNRTAFLRSLDRLGYAHLCDVFDQNNWGGGTTNNQLAGRATLEQVTGYSVIVQDAGSFASHTTLPMGGAVEGFFPQTQWYRDWLASAAVGEPGRATLWLVGSDIAQATSWESNPLVYGDMGVTLVSTGQPARVYPQVLGQTSFTWADSTTTDFTGDAFRLSGRYCPAQFPYDGLGASGTAVVTHRLEPGSTPGEGAFVLNANPAAGWNTILSSVVWEDITDSEGSPPGTPGDLVAGRILQAVLPPGCVAQVNPTDVAGGGRALPAVTRLGSNYPNPFNPATTIVFDLAHGGSVRVDIFDVAGRRVRTLVNAKLDAGWNHRATWNGRDETGHPVSAGLYFCRLEAAGQSATRKLVLLQ